MSELASAAVTRAHRFSSAEYGSLSGPSRGHRLRQSHELGNTTTRLLVCLVPSATGRFTVKWRRSVRSAAAMLACLIFGHVRSRQLATFNVDSGLYESVCERCERPMIRLRRGNWVMIKSRGFDPDVPA